MVAIPAGTSRLVNVERETWGLCLRTKENEMPKGVPSAGFRKTKNASVRVEKIRSLLNSTATLSSETDEEIETKLAERFEVLTELTDDAVAGVTKSLIVSGPAGLGKSFTVEKALEQYDPDGTRHEIIKGYVRATGLFRSLYEFRHHGNIIVFDDADTIFFDETSLNMLKVACDSTERRIISWRSESRFEDEDGGVIPKSFQFNGTIIFITNHDMDSMIDRGHKLAPHFQALISRSHYIDLAMKTKRDYIIRIKQVIKAGMLKEQGYNSDQESDVLAFIDKNADNLRELSLRMAIKLAALRKSNASSFQKKAKITCCRNG